MPVDLTACHCVRCQADGELDDPQITVDQIEKHGWLVIMVPADDEGPGWAYTVGLWHTHRIPELALFGLDVHKAQVLLNALAQRAVDGHPVEADQERTDIANVPMVLKSVDYRWYKAFFGSAIRFYVRPPFPFLQVVWPSASGVLPWQDGGEVLLAHQPRLWELPDEHPEGIWTREL